MAAQTDTDKFLRGHGVRPSLQRRAIFEFLVKNPVHPTAEEVYRALSPQIRTLSRTTVYNTLRLFCERGAAQMITPEENEMRFDALLGEHGHFKCTACGRIFDFACGEAFAGASAALPEGFVAEQTQLYVRGLCKNCRESGAVPAGTRSA